jgi:hypothetical protein
VERKVFSAPSRESNRRSLMRRVWYHKTTASAPVQRWRRNCQISLPIANHFVQEIVHGIVHPSALLIRPSLFVRNEKNRHKTMIFFRHETTLVLGARDRITFRKQTLTRKSSSRLLAQEEVALVIWPPLSILEMKVASCIKFSRKKNEKERKTLSVQCGMGELDAWLICKISLDKVRFFFQGSGCHVPFILAHASNIKIAGVRFITGRG